MEKFKRLFTLLALIPLLTSAASNSKLTREIIEKSIFENDDNTRQVLFNMIDDLKLKTKKNVDIRLGHNAADYENFISINQNSGEIAILGAIDREMLCEDQQLQWLETIQTNGGGKNDLKNTVEDLQESGNLEDCILDIGFFVTYEKSRKRQQQEILVELRLTIKDVNDNVPEFIDDEKLLRIRENNKIDRKFKLPSANDPDLPPNTIVKYTLKNDDTKTDKSGKNQPDASKIFQVNTRKNPVDGSLVPFLVVKKSIDREQTPSFNLKLVAEDGSAKTGEMSINIKIIDENDNVPQFMQKEPVVEVPDDKTKGSVIYTVKATDNDFKSKITYHMDANTKTQDRKMFEVDELTGDVRLKQDLGGLRLRKRTRHVHITARDADEQDDNMYQESSLMLTVEITQANNRLPKITVQYLDDIKGIFENKPNTEHVAVVTANDPDENPVSVKISETAIDDSASFILKAAFGENSKKQVYVLKPKSDVNFDREKKAVYQFTLIASDEGTPPQTAEEQFTLNILDVNDNAPSFEKSERKFRIQETRTVGKLATIEAEDNDIGENAELKYEFALDAEVIYTNSPDYKRVDSKDLPIQVDESGSLILKQKVDAERIEKITVQVIAKDGKYEAMQTLVFEILDVNEQAPEFTKDKFEFQIKENDGQIPTKNIGTVTANDSDRDSDIIYEIVTPDAYKGKNLDFPFVINSNGVITSKLALNREHKAKYVFKVRALDKNRKINKGKIGVASVEITVLDVNDNAPELCVNKQNSCATSENKITVINCDKQKSETVVLVEAQDKDADWNSKLTYKVLKQKEFWAAEEEPEVSLFGFKKGNDKEALVLNRDLSERDVGPYIVEIEVKDGGIPAKFITSSVKIYINSKSHAKNDTEAALTFKNEPSGFLVFVEKAGRQFTDYSEYFSGQGVDGVAQILIAATVVAFMILLIIACCYISRYNCSCCCCYVGDETKSENAKHAYQGGNTVNYGENGSPAHVSNGGQSGYNTVGRNMNEHYSAKIVDYPEHQNMQYQGGNGMFPPDLSADLPLLNNGDMAYVHGVGTFGKVSLNQLH